MGASPDGVIVWEDGTVEACECKNHAPFRENGAFRRGAGGGQGGGRGGGAPNDGGGKGGGGGGERKGGGSRGRIGDGSGGKSFNKNVGMQGGGGRGGGGGGGGRKIPKGRFIIADQGPHTEIGPWHVAQLSWHMLCLGPHCRSAVFVSSSATKA
ncbi:hypothetical protein VYU27_010767, partial [Nannochloropsis oceanica]